MTTRKHPIRSTVRVNAYAVISRAVEEGVAAGWRRAHKHTGRPSAEAVRSAIEDAVMLAVCEVFEFGEEA